MRAQWNALIMTRIYIYEHETHTDLYSEAKQIQLAKEFHYIIWREKILPRIITYDSLIFAKNWIIEVPL